MLNTGIYLQLAPVLLGNGTIQQAAEKAAVIGITKAMVVSDEGVEAAGHVETLKKVLDEAGMEYVVWTGSKKDCPDYTVVEAAAIALENGVNGVIGIGGGSVMDTAKAVAAVVVNGEEILHDIALYITYQKTYEAAPLPVLEIPTTAGTGSECTFVAVVTSTDLDTKIGLPVDPTYAIVDPELTLTLPQDITAFTGMDVLSHVTEALAEKKNTAHSDLLAYEAMRLVHEYLPRVVADGNDIEARNYMSYASNLAGISFNESGIHVGHGCAHALGHVYDLDHGVCCANLTPAIIRFTARDFPEKIKKLGEIFGAVFEDSDTPEQIGDRTAEKVIDFGKSIGIQSLKDKGLSREDAVAVAERANNDYLSHCYVEEVTLADIEEILAEAFEDFLD